MQMLAAAEQRRDAEERRGVKSEAGVQKLRAEAAAGGRPAANSNDARRNDEIVRGWQT